MYPDVVALYRLRGLGIVTVLHGKVNQQKLLLINISIIHIPVTGVHTEEAPFNLARGRTTYQSSHSVPHVLEAGHAVGEQFIYIQTN